MTATDTPREYAELETELINEHRAEVEAIQHDLATLTASIASRNDATRRTSILSRLFKK